MAPIIIKYKTHSPELIYTLDVVFTEFLGIDYYFIQSDSNNLYIEQDGSDAKLVLNASFWENISKNGMYTNDNIPALPLLVWSPKEKGLDAKLVEDNIPILFGTKKYKKIKAKQYLDIDIFGIIFFMLSRYEESVIKTTDSHQRFPATASIAYQADFLHRPIADEYVEILWSCIKQCWPQLARKKRIAKTLVSCDVDAPYSPAIKNVFSLGRQVAGDIIKRKSIKKAINSLINPVASLFGYYQYEVYDTFEWIMDVNEQVGNRVAFYFITDHSAGAIDGCYTLEEPRIRTLMSKIHERGHEIGLHCSYNSYQDLQQTNREAMRLDKTLQELNIVQDTIGCRQHFLRWKSPETAYNLNETGLISYDTSLSFADWPGFRCGTCHEYPMYDLVNRQAFDLVQRPLIVMECSIIADRYMGLGYSDEAMQAFLSYKDTCKKFDGNFTLLWHNSHFTTNQDKIFYKELIQ